MQSVSSFTEVKGPPCSSDLGFIRNLVVFLCIMQKKINLKIKFPFPELQVSGAFLEEL